MPRLQDEPEILVTVKSAKDGDTITLAKVGPDKYEVLREDSAGAVVPKSHYGPHDFSHAFEAFVNNIGYSRSLTDRDGRMTDFLDQLGRYIAPEVKANEA